MRALVATIVVGAVLAGCQPHDPTVRKTPVTVLEEREGIGRAARQEDMVTINYRLNFENGATALSGDHFRFVLGTHAVIEGIDDAVAGMRVGGYRMVEIPPHKHWGRGGYGNGAIPANETLTAHIDLIEID